LAIIFLTSAGQSASTNHVFRSKAHLGDGRPYIKSDKRSHPDADHTVVFAIKQRNVDKLEEKLMEVSDPHSPKYGQHWTREEVGEFTQNREGSAAVLAYLQSKFGASQIAVEKRSLYDEYIVVRGKVLVWEEMFATRFFEFAHKDWHGKTIHRALEYSLPTELDAHIESVGHVAEFPTPIKGKIVAKGALPDAKKADMLRAKGPYSRQD
jgi:tripeptidyl-peptidase-1